MGRFLAFIDRLFGAIGHLFQSPLLLALRLFFGIGFFLAGFSKLQNISGFADNLLTLHIPYPNILAWVVALTEMTCGICLALGFLSRLVAIPLIAIMCVAYATAHAEALHSIFQDPKLFVSQPPFPFLLTALLVFAFGPGLFSLDVLFKRWGRKDEQKLAK